MDEGAPYPWLADLLDPRAWPAAAGAVVGTDADAAGRERQGAASQGAGAGAANRAAPDVRRVDTHISHVFLSGHLAFKLRRPVRLAFLDFSSADERLADCLREVALNHRLAPDVYLGVAPVRRGADGRAFVGEPAEGPASGSDVLEHGVVMRRLPEGRDLKSMIERGEARTAHVDRVADRLAAFHAAHAVEPDGQQWLARTTGPARANFEALAHVAPDLAPPELVETLRAAAERFAAEHADDLEARRRRGRVVDGHGDLHAEHVWFETDDAEPLMVDCLEFRDDFRVIDAASDAAFLAMDLAYRGRDDLAARFLGRYAMASGDYALFAVVDYFLAYRALVRAKVAALVAGDADMSAARRAHAVDSVRDHLALAARFLAPRRPGPTWLVAGTVGTGKTTVAAELADRIGGVVLSSDRLRPPAGEEAAPRYSLEARSAVYARLFAEARAVVRSGRPVVLDATFGRRAWRDEARAWAASEGSTAFLVEVVAPGADVKARLAARRALGTDASEAGPELVDSNRAAFEPADEWPAAQRGVVDTSAAGWRHQVADLVGHG